ncbi:MAG: RNA 2',3'-cyclic phosphodiesterase, partial [Acidobacteria bacterium]
MVRKRIFIAIDVSEDAKQVIAAHINLLRREFPDLRVNWEKAEKLHLTLKFLGETEIVLLEQLKHRISLDAASVESFCFTITGSGVFPGIRNPKVLWLGIQEHSGSLRKLQRSIDNSCV